MTARHSLPRGVNNLSDMRQLWDTFKHTQSPAYTEQKTTQDPPSSEPMRNKFLQKIQREIEQFARNESPSLPDDFARDELPELDLNDLDSHLQDTFQRWDQQMDRRAECEVILS